VDIKKRLTKEVAVTGTIFLALAAILTVFFLNLNSNLNTLITQSEPNLNAMNRLLIDVQQDNALLLEYLDTHDLSEANKYNQEMQSGQCEGLTLEQAELNGVTTEACAEAAVLFSDVQKIRNKILEVHKKDIISNSLSIDKTLLLQDYTKALNSATKRISDSIIAINAKNADLRNTLLLQLRIYFASIALLIISFVIVLAKKIRKVGSEIISPLDQTISATKEFVSGNYAVELFPSGSLPEMNELQNTINNVFRVIEKHVKDPAERKKIETTLLKREYLEILDLIKNSSIAGKKISIKDVKANLHITHPTAISRIRYLQQIGILGIEKEGREKFLHML